MKKKRYIIYLALLLLLVAFSVWVFHEPDHLAELKETEEVRSGFEAPAAVVEEAIEAIGQNDTRRLSSLLLLRDPTEFERNLGPLLAEPPLLPVKILGCTRLVRSSRSDNIQIHVYSETRDKTYLFALLQDRTGVYKIYSVGASGRRP